MEYIYTCAKNPRMSLNRQLNSPMSHRVLLLFRKTGLIPFFGIKHLVHRVLLERGLLPIRQLQDTQRYATPAGVALRKAGTDPQRNVNCFRYIIKHEVVSRR